MNGSCMFADTLVDRIVPGFPADNIDEVKAELQFDDNCVVKGELYHLWAIGGAQWERIREEFPSTRPVSMCYLCRKSRPSATRRYGFSMARIPEWCLWRFRWDARASATLSAMRPSAVSYTIWWPRRCSR